MVIDPWERDCPEEDSVGTKPRYAPILEPVRRSQSLTSTANPNAVSVAIPRRHPKGWTTGVYSLSAAIASIALSRRSLRALVVT